MSELYIYLTIYIAILLGISFFIARKEKSEDFLISGRDRSGWAILASKFAGAIGAGFFVTYTAYAYEFGVGVLMVILGTAVGYFVFGFWAAPKIYKNSIKKKFYTMGDFVFDVTKNEFSRQLTNLVSLAIAFVWLMTSVIGGVKIISYLGLMSYEVAILATVLVVMAYILLAGFRSVMTTDIFQSLIILILMVALSYFMLNGENIGTILEANTGSLKIIDFVAFLLFGILMVFSSPGWYQLCYSAKNEKNLKTGISFAVVPIVVVTALLLFIGLFVKVQSPGLDPGVVFVEALKSHLPIGMLSFGVVLFVAGMMSSIDSNVYSFASHYVLSKKTKDPIKKIRLVVIFLSGVMMIVAFFWRDIVEVTILAAAINMLISLPMIYLLVGKNNPNRFIGSALGGIFGLIGGVVFFGLGTTVVATLLGGSILGLFCKSFSWLGFPSFYSEKG